MEDTKRTVDNEVAPLIAKAHSDWSALALKYRATRKCVSSKAALLVLLWSFTVALGYGLVLNPDTYMQVSSAILAFNMALIVYGCIFILFFIFFPLAGYLADVKFGRYKTVLRSLYLIVLSAMVAAVAAGIGAMMFVLLLYEITGLVVGSIAFFVAGIASIFLLVGYIGFIPNVLQFGMDQLQDSPEVDRTLFIHWYVWVYYAGVFIAQLSWNIPLNYTVVLTYYPPINYYTGMFLSASLLFAVSLASVCLGYHKQRWFFIEPNPCHQNAVIDTKCVKAILKVLLSFGMVFFLDFGASSTLPLFAQHNTPYTTYKVDDYNPPNPYLLKYNKTFPAQEVLINSGILSPLLVVVCIPLYLFLLRPFISGYIPGTLKRMGTGMCLVLLSLMLTFSLDTATHNMHKNSLCMFEVQLLDYNTPPPSPLLDTSFNNVLVIQSILSALSNMLIYIAVFEFICSQSPHSRKGLLIGFLYAIKGLYQMLAAALVVPYIFWSKPLPSCGFGYYLMNILIGVFAVVVYVWVARRYKYRDVLHAPDCDLRIEP